MSNVRGAPMTRKRGHVALIEKAASLAGHFLGMSYDERKDLTAHQMMMLLHFDHDPEPHANGGPDLHFNLTPLTIMAHRRKTATIDVPQIAKTKRIAKKDAIHKANLALKAGRLAEADEALRAIADKARSRPKQKIAQRVNAWPPKGSRKLRSRGFERRAS